MEFTIACAESADLPELAAIERTCFSHPWSEQSLQALFECADALTLTARNEKKILGYLSMQTVVDEGYLNNIAVLPDFRRQGIALALMRAAIEQGRQRKLSFLTLEVRAHNQPAQKLYERLGFDRVGLRRNYYSDPTEDAVLMTYYYPCLSGRREEGETKCAY